VTAQLDGQPYHHVPSGHLLVPKVLELERSLIEARVPAAIAYAAANHLNQIRGAVGPARLGIVAAGKSYTDLCQAFADAGFGERELNALGIRLLKIGLLWPLEAAIVREFAQGLEEILVVEEKRPFLETQIKEVLYRAPQAPRVLGARDEQGQILFSQLADLEADDIVLALTSRLRTRPELASDHEALATTHQPLRQTKR
jgi:indolepyruvate ferredoxin oxidoreductase